MRLVNAEASLPKGLHSLFGVYRFGRVDAQQPGALAGAKEQGVAIYDSLNIFKLARRYARVWWIEESGEQRHEDKSWQRPFPVESAEREAGVHGDAFSTSAVEASRQTCGAIKIRFSSALVCGIPIAGGQSP
jgi:hypothetical protein